MVGTCKTRLADEFLAWATAQGADVLRGKAYEAGGRLPYQPVVAALRARLQGVADPQRLLNTTWLAELCRLLPELVDAVPLMPAPLQVPEIEARIRLFEAVARFGQALAVRNYRQVYVGFTRWVETEALARQGAAARAAEDLRRATAERPALPRDTLQYLRASAVLSATAGAYDVALASLERAGALADELGLLHDRRQIDVALATMYTRSGDEQQAARCRASAAAIGKQIAQGIDDTALRDRLLASFSNLP